MGIMEDAVAASQAAQNKAAAVKKATSGGGYSQSGAQISANVSKQKDVQRYQSTGSKGGSTPRYVSEGGGGGSRELTPTGYKSTGSGRTVTRKTAGASGGGGASGPSGGINISDPQTQKFLSDMDFFPEGFFGPSQPLQTPGTDPLAFREALGDTTSRGLNAQNSFVGADNSPPFETAQMVVPDDAQGLPGLPGVVGLGGGNEPTSDPFERVYGPDYGKIPTPEEMAAEAERQAKLRDWMTNPYGGVTQQPQPRRARPILSPQQQVDNEIAFNKPPVTHYRKVTDFTAPDPGQVRVIDEKMAAISAATNAKIAADQETSQRILDALTGGSFSQSAAEISANVPPPLVTNAAQAPDDMTLVLTPPVDQLYSKTPEAMEGVGASDRGVSRGQPRAVPDAWEETNMPRVDLLTKNHAMPGFEAGGVPFMVEGTEYGTPPALDPQPDPTSIIRPKPRPASMTTPPQPELTSSIRPMARPAWMTTPLAPPQPELGFGPEITGEPREVAPLAMGVEVPSFGEGQSILGRLPLTEAMLSRREASSYDTLFDDSQEDFGWYPSQHTIQENFDFGRAGYGAWVKGKSSKKKFATPMGRYQFVGNTMLEVADEMGLPRDTVFTPAVQDAMFSHLAQSKIDGRSDAKAVAALKGTWDGFKEEGNPEVLAVVNELRAGLGDAPVLSNKDYNPTDPLGFNMGVEVGSEGDTVPSFDVDGVVSDDPNVLYTENSDPVEWVTPAPGEFISPQASEALSFGSEVVNPLPDGRFPIDLDGIPEGDATEIKPEKVRGAVPAPDGESVVVEQETDDGKIKRVKIPWYVALAMGLVAGPLGSMAANGINAMGGIPIDPNAKPGERYQSGGGGGRGFSESVDGDGGTPSIPTDAPPWWPPGMPWPPVSSGGTGPTVPPYEPPPPQDYTRYQTLYNPVQSAFDQGIGGMVQGMRDGGMVAPYASSRGSLQSTMNNGALGFRR